MPSGGAGRGAGAQPVPPPRSRPSSPSRHQGTPSAAWFAQEESSWQWLAWSWPAWASTTLRPGRSQWPMYAALGRIAPNSTTTAPIATNRLRLSVPIDQTYPLNYTGQGSGGGVGGRGGGGGGGAGAAPGGP